MELVAPAGNFEKLQYAFAYGADAVYIGLKKFSLRVKADNFYENEFEHIINLKKSNPSKKLFCALNISFHNDDIDNFISEIDYFTQYPFDSFIIQDIGLVSLIQKHFPHAALHLSTQANCINREAAKIYKQLGFKRIVLGREASLKEIRQIKDAVPDMELEVFAHGAMCIAYSGRCLLSAYTTNRSANAGFCSHSCRWDYTVLEEKERPGEYFPIFEGENFTAVLSSKDLCMIDHLDDLQNAGVDSLKIEGRMKSVYYVALVARAYRKAIDALDGKITQETALPFVNELYKTAHREFATGFYYSSADADKTTCGATKSEYDLVATIGKKIEAETVFFEKAHRMQEQAQRDFQAMHPQKKEALADKKPPVQYLQKKGGFALYEYHAMNKLDSTVPLEYIAPHIVSIEDFSYQFIDPQTGAIRTWISHGHPCLLYTDKPIGENYIVRTKLANQSESKKDLAKRNYD